MAHPHQFFEIEKGRRFIAGLFWQPLSGSSSHQKDESRRVALELGLDLVVWRNGSTPAVGLASSKDGAKPGIYSAASVISKTLEIEAHVRNFICAIKISDDRFLFVSQINGVIVHDGDFVDSEDRVRARFLEGRSILEWEVMVAPAHWNLSGASERTFESFLPTKDGKVLYKRWWTLKPIKSNLIRTLVPFIGIAVVAIFVIFGWKKWQAHQAVLELQRLNAQQAIDSSAPVVKLEHPWKNQGEPSLVANSCIDAMSKIPSLTAGVWALIGMSCSNGMMIATWSSPNGGVAQMLLANPGAVIGDKGNSATLMIPYDAAVGAADELVEPLFSSRLKLQTAVEQIGASITFTEKTPPPPTLPGDKSNTPVPVKDWKELSWEVSTPLSPLTVLSPMTGPGVRVNELYASFDSNGGLSWKLKGTLYVQP